MSSFSQFQLHENLMRALEDIGYEKPSPIQVETIPHILTGCDVIGQAQTGTGKTAAFALPLLSKLNKNLSKTQILVLTPTRELTIQVSEALKKYAKYMKGVEVLSIYGGQSYSTQIRALKHGATVVVGTPGRVMDHMRRGTLDLASLTCMVLDEADEMLNMGFLDDIQWVIEQCPKDRQMVLFSATMPKPIQKIAQRYLKDPINVAIKAKTATASTINQRFIKLKSTHKLEALTRILEAEVYDGLIIFARTKQTTLELAEKLKSLNFKCAAINGDMEQKQREKAINDLKSKKLDIVIATDVAARGLDVERITHVINFDAPFNVESYIHRIGRTGRAGRTGEAILFVTPSELRQLNFIERTTKQKIEPMVMPSIHVINEKRVFHFKNKILGALNHNASEVFHRIIQEICTEQSVTELQVATAIAKLMQGPQPFLLTEDTMTLFSEEKYDRGAYAQRNARNHDRNHDRNQDRKRKTMPKNLTSYRIGIGKMHGVKPGQIVGAIANEASLSSEFIGDIKIHNDYSTVELPKDLSDKALKILERTWVAGRQLKIAKSYTSSRRKS